MSSRLFYLLGGYYLSFIEDKKNVKLRVMETFFLFKVLSRWSYKMAILEITEIEQIQRVADNWR